MFRLRGISAHSGLYNSTESVVWVVLSIEIKWADVVDRQQIDVKDICHGIFQCFPEMNAFSILVRKGVAPFWPLAGLWKQL